MSKVHISIEHRRGEITFVILPEGVQIKIPLLTSDAELVLANLSAAIKASKQ